MPVAMKTLYPPLSSLIGASVQPSEDVRFDSEDVRFDSEDVRFDAVEMRLGGHQILRDISLTLRRRETVAIVGESGCGKTTLLKLIIGLLEPTAGRVIILGKDIASMDNREQCSLRRHFGFLFQAAALFDSMSVADNIAFGLRAQGILPDREIRPIVQQKLADVGLAQSVAAMFPAELSGGMRKRVGLARALAVNPEFMLFDEPTTGLDPIMSDVINDLILKVKRDLGITAILVTHEMQTVRKVADRVIMLAAVHQIDPDQPQILFDGPVAQFLNSTDPCIRRFIEGNASGLDSGGPTVPAAPNFDQGFQQNAPVQKEAESPLRWIVPQILSPTQELLPTTPKPQTIAPVESPLNRKPPVLEKPEIVLEPIKVEAQVVTVAPPSLDQIPGQLTLSLASSPIVQDWELGKDFLPELPPKPDPTPVADLILPLREVDIVAQRIDACPLPLENGPDNLSVAVAKSPSASEPWNLGEEFLGPDLIEKEVVPLAQTAPTDNRVEVLREPGDALEQTRFEGNSLTQPMESEGPERFDEEPPPPLLDQVPLFDQAPLLDQVPFLDEPGTDSMVLEEPRRNSVLGEDAAADGVENSGIEEDRPIALNPTASLEQSP